MMFNISNSRKYKLTTLTIVLVALIIAMMSLTSCDRRAIDPNSIRITEFTTVGEFFTLYQDDGATHLIAYAQVRDQNNFPMPGQAVRFRVTNNIEQVKLFPATAISDTTGLAFLHIEVHGDALQGQDSLPVQIGAYIDNRLHKNLRLTLQKDPDVDRIEWNLQSPMPNVVDVNQPIYLIAIPFDSNDNPLPDGTIVRFESNLGTFLDADNFPRRNVPVLNGRAETFWNAGTQADSTKITARIGNVVSDTLRTTVKPGMPTSINFLDPPIDTNVNGVSDTLRVQLADRFGNLIEGAIIRFTSLNSDELPLGSITPQNVSSNEFGMANVLFTPGPISGHAIVTATSGDSARAEIMIEIKSIEANFIRFVNEEPIDLSIRGGGGAESASIGVSVFDRSGNLVTEPNMIRFTVVDAPDEVTINDIPWLQSQDCHPDPIPVREQTHGGIAYVSISSGTRIGSVQIRADLVELDEPHAPVSPAVSTSRGGIVVHAGPPDEFELVYPPGGNIFTSAGAGIWQTVIGVMVRDSYGNPVRVGTPVVFGSSNLRRHQDLNFFLPEHTVINQDWVNVFGHAFVGNVSVNEDSAQGVAYTTLLFHGRSSNHFIDIDIYYGNEEKKMQDKTIKLWMVSPDLEIEVFPGFIEWTRNPVPGNPIGYFVGNVEGNTMLQVRVVDGQRTPIVNAPVYFTTTRGYFKDISTLPNRILQNGNRLATDSEWPTEMMFELGGHENWIGQSTPNTPFTAPTDVNGIQRKLFYMLPSLIPPSDDFPIETTVDIVAYLLGEDGTSRQVIVLLRSWLAPLPPPTPPINQD